MQSSGTWQALQLTRASFKAHDLLLRRLIQSMLKIYISCYFGVIGIELSLTSLLFVRRPVGGDQRGKVCRLSVSPLSRFTRIELRVIEAGCHALRT